VFHTLKQSELGSARLRPAVQAAIMAFARSGRMLDAALAYAGHGLPVFPLDVRSKAPIPKRDPDPTGKLKQGIPGTGGVYKATTDPQQIIP
jgi:Bifunctional DNA primase/polymerase, N-terminal